MSDVQIVDGVDTDALEVELRRIPEVTAARVVAGSDGHVSEVHILSLPSKHPKQVVRDVQSVAMATFGIDVDRRVVSVVQLDADVKGGPFHPDVDLVEDPDGVATGDSARINVDTVTADRAGTQCKARVVLSREDEQVTGAVEGLVAPASVLRLIAQATLSALRELEPVAAHADIETATIIRLGDRSIAVCTVVVVVPPYEEIISGSAVVRFAGEFDAVARSVLDATNRRLRQLR